MRSSIPVNREDPNSVSAANYTGKLSLPYPPFVLAGEYNSTTSNIVFGQVFDLPFGGLHLEYSVDVNLEILQIVQRFFHGRIAEPVAINVLGTLDVVDCVIDMAGNVDIPAEGITLDTSLVLELCDNCTHICSAQEVHLSIQLDQPLNISISGSYSLLDDVRSIELSGGVAGIQGFEIDLFTTLQSMEGNVNLTEFQLRMQIPHPVNATVEGFYSQSSDVASLSGQLSLAQVMLALKVSVDIEKKTLSEVSFSSDITMPFTIMLSGSYSLTSMSPFARMEGRLNVDSLLDLSVMAQADLGNRQLSNFTFMGMLIIPPLRVAVSAHYANALPSSDLTLSGIVAISGSIVTMEATLNTSSDPISILEITLSGVFPPPLDFINFTGSYSQHCACALLHGMVYRDSFGVLVSTNLTLQSSAEITSLQVQVNLAHPFFLENILTV